VGDDSTCTLYEIEYELIYLLDTLEGLLPDEEETRANSREIRRGPSRDQKVDGISHMLATSNRKPTCGCESKRLQARKRRLSERGKARALREKCHGTGGVKKLEGQTTRCPCGLPASVLISDFEVVPAEYKEIRTEVVINKEAVRRAEGGRKFLGLVCQRVIPTWCEDDHREKLDQAQAVLSSDRMT